MLIDSRKNIKKPVQINKLGQAFLNILGDGVIGKQTCDAIKKALNKDLDYKCNTILTKNEILDLYDFANPS